MLVAPLHTGCPFSGAWLMPSLGCFGGEAWVVRHDGPCTKWSLAPLYSVGIPFLYVNQTGGVQGVRMNHRGSAMEHLRGLFSITITPFHTDGTPETLAAQVERRLCRGI
jgi:hypothetical protein